MALSRGRLRRVLKGQEQAIAIAPQVERHALRLEGIDAEAPSTDDLLRALRTAQGLYDLDAVAVGRAGLAALDACRQAAAGSQAPLPAPEDILTQAPLPEVANLVLRLHATLGDRAGVMVALPTPAAVVTNLALDESSLPWATQVVQQIIGKLGPCEPDLLLLVPPSSVFEGRTQPSDNAQLPAAVRRMADFYDIALVETSQSEVASLHDADFRDTAELDVPPSARLVTTGTELDPNLDPHRVKEVLLAVRMSGARPFLADARTHRGDISHDGGLLEP